MSYNKFEKDRHLSWRLAVKNPTERIKRKKRAKAARAARRRNRK